MQPFSAQVGDMNSSDIDCELVLVDNETENINLSEIAVVERDSSPNELRIIFLAGIIQILIISKVHLLIL